MKTWLHAQPDQPATIADLQALLDRFAELYNSTPPPIPPQRAIPAAAYAARPKATPAERTDTHFRVRHDRVDKTGRVTLRHAGRLHHIGLGPNTPEPPSSSSSPTSTCASSTPPPASSSATSPSTPTATTSPSADPQDLHPDKPQQPEPRKGFGPSGMS